MQTLKIPEISLLLLVGPSRSGKTIFAKQYFAAAEVISFQQCTAHLSDEAYNPDLKAEAFEMLCYLVTKRLEKGKLTLIDDLHLNAEDRAILIKLGKKHHAQVLAIAMDCKLESLLQRYDESAQLPFGKGVLEKQYDDFKNSLKSIKKEGFSQVYMVNPTEPIDIQRTKLWSDKKAETGPFDIIGDVHGCFDELILLMQKMGYVIDLQANGHYQVTCPEGRRIVFVGDLTDRGPKSPEVLRLVMDMVEAQQAFCVRGNHDDKLQRYLSGKSVKVRNGLESTVEQLAAYSEEFKTEVHDFLDKLVAHYVFDEGRLVVAHAGLKESMQGRASGAVSSFCLYGETTGKKDEFGLPIRINWSNNYSGKAMVVYGHTPVPKAEWINLTIDIDTGCVFGGTLTALRYPERQILSVPCLAQYAVPARPMLPLDRGALTLRELPPAVEAVDGKYVIETRFQAKVILSEAKLLAAKARLAELGVNLNGLIYLPPSIAYLEAPASSEYLEHPKEIFKYYDKKRVERLICQEKQRGTTAVVLISQSAEAASARFGLEGAALGRVYTASGEGFFKDEAQEVAFLDALQMALNQSYFWESFNSDWLCLEGDICTEIDAEGLEQIQYAPVHLLATEGQTYFEQTHLWHLEELSKIIAANPTLLKNTSFFEVDLNDYDSQRAAIAWWLALTENGGVGMVVKPINFLTYHNERLIQPAMECRGKEYLRSIYGPEYDLGENLLLLKSRNVKQGRALAMQEFSLGLEALSRFVDGAPVDRVWECVFGGLGLP